MTLLRELLSATKRLASVILQDLFCTEIELMNLGEFYLEFNLFFCIIH